MAFQKIVLTVAGISLILALIAIAVIIARSKKTMEYPPVSSQCPDYWEMKLIDGKNVCMNTKGLGNGQCPNEMNFNIPPWNLSDSLCKKQLWAKKCDLTWDGVTNSATVCSSHGKPVSTTTSGAVTDPTIFEDIRDDWNRFTAKL
jgi:hypothetical protein